MTREMDKMIGWINNGQDWYEIEVDGCINPRWFEWPDGGEITPLPNGNTLLSCWVRDQPALHGIIARIRDLNIKIISLKKSLTPQSDQTPGMQQQE